MPPPTGMSALAIGAGRRRAAPASGAGHGVPGRGRCRPGGRGELGEGCRTRPGTRPTRRPLPSHRSPQHRAPRDVLAHAHSVPVVVVYGDLSSIVGMPGCSPPRSMRCGQGARRAARRWAARHTLKFRCRSTFGSRMAITTRAQTAWILQVSDALASRVPGSFADVAGAGRLRPDVTTQEEMCISVPLFRFGVPLVVTALAVAACDSRSDTSSSTGTAAPPRPSRSASSRPFPATCPPSAWASSTRSTWPSSRPTTATPSPAGRSRSSPEDDEAKPDVGKNAATKLAADDRLIGVVGTLNSSVAQQRAARASRPPRSPRCRRPTPTRR